jgi:hypothetical protein
MLIDAVRAAARAAAERRTRLGGVRGKIVSVLRDLFPSAAELAKVGSLILILRQLRAAVGAPRQLVRNAPRIYRRYRQQALKDGRFFTPTVATRTAQISPDETDVLILVMLRNARQLLTYNNALHLRNATDYDWLESIKNRYLMQVFVDEATDFSVVQLACMLELTHPLLRSWFACSDLQQRVTRNGLQEISELDWLKSTASLPIDVQHVNISYRQSRKLRELTANLFTL